MILPSRLCLSSMNISHCSSFNWISLTLLCQNRFRVQKVIGMISASYGRQRVNGGAGSLETSKFCRCRFHPSTPDTPKFNVVCPDSQVKRALMRSNKSIAWLHMPVMTFWTLHKAMAIYIHNIMLTCDMLLWQNSIHHARIREKSGGYSSEDWRSSLTQRYIIQ